MSNGPSQFRAVRFALVDLLEQVEAFAQRWPGARVDGDGITFVAPAGIARLRLPLSAPRPATDEWIGDYGERLPTPPERQVVLLLRAGAMAIGYWHGDELLHHKAVRKYVVRGSGKAQQTHQKTRGKSRYGSRLRLLNWRHLLTATSERLRAYCAEYGEPDRIFHAAPVRVWAELFAAEPPPPFARDDAVLQRVPMHVHRPDHEELLRVRTWLQHGRLELPA